MGSYPHRVGRGEFKGIPPTHGQKKRDLRKKICPLNAIDYDFHEIRLVDKQKKRPVLPDAFWQDWNP
jgi:hypothetical protein